MAEQSRDRLWPALMSAQDAAAYVGECSSRAFLRRVGTVYPPPIRIPGRGNVWRKTELDQRIAALGKPSGVYTDLADVL